MRHACHRGRRRPWEEGENGDPRAEEAQRRRRRGDAALISDGTNAIQQTPPASREELIERLRNSGARRPDASRATSRGQHGIRHGVDCVHEYSAAAAATSAASGIRRTCELAGNGPGTLGLCAVAGHGVDQQSGGNDDDADVTYGITGPRAGVAAEAVATPLPADAAEGLYSAADGGMPTASEGRGGDGGIAIRGPGERAAPQIRGQRNSPTRNGTARNDCDGATAVIAACDTPRPVLLSVPAGAGGEGSTSQGATAVDGERKRRRLRGKQSLSHGGSAAGGWHAAGRPPD